MQRFFLPIALAGVVVLLAPADARACGNNTHAWISIAARDRLPDGPLKTLLTTHENALRNGTLFPDGGYPIGHGYGEAAHWEPFQDRYAAWIRSHFPDESDPERARHVAFLLGLASHGMADQFYDATFMEASKAHDPGWHDGKDDAITNFDAVTDMHWVTLHGAQGDPERWFPGDTFVQLFAEVGIEVDVATMKRGADLVGTGIVLAAEISEDEYHLRNQERRFPWAFERMDLHAQGAPKHIAEAVAAYWQVLVSRLGGGDWSGAPVLLVKQPELDSASAYKAGEVEPRLGVVFAHGLSNSKLDPSKFHLLLGERELPIRLNLFYREASHVVNVLPEEDLEECGIFQLHVDPGVEAFDGTVSTAAYSATVLPQGTNCEPPRETGCASAFPGFLLLGALVTRRSGGRSAAGPRPRSS